MPGLLDVLNILTPVQVRQLLNGSLGQLGGSLGGLTGSSNSGGSTGGVTSGLGLPRVMPNDSYQQRTDPFRLAERGLDPGVGTLLLQGVALPVITSTTKKQLIAFVILTLVGVSFVGARYARLDRLFYDSTYSVNAHFEQSGGIFTGAEVTYRGVGVGQVSTMKLTDKGVDVLLSIDKSEDKIPEKTLALVGNKSAVGEQYVELQPKQDGGPYLKDGSEIDTPETAIPVSTTEILTNLDNLVQSVPQADLRTVVAESGAAFKDAGPSIGQIVDTSTSFIETAEANLDTTTALIKDSRVVLQTQVDKGSAIRSFSRDLALFSGTLAANDKTLRSLIDNGSATANQLRTFLQQNRVNLGQLINNLVTTGEVTVKHLKGIRQILVIYPYIVAGGFTVAKKGRDGKYDAQFGLVLQQDGPVCKAGYDQSEVRPPQDPRTCR